MCGIVGIIPKSKVGFSTDERDAFMDGLYIDALRGTDGTGVMYGRNNGETVIMKEASPAWEFLGKPEAKTMSQELFGNSRWAFGHNRAATRGVKKDENSHPFIVDNHIVLLQNGTYVGDHKHHKNTEVDTEAVAHVIAEHPGELETALQKINAAYVLVWWNDKEKSLNIIRNHERPLWWTEDTLGSLFFFSEWGIMYAACDRHDINFKHAPKEVPVGTHIKFDFSAGPREDYTITKTKLDIAYKGTVRPFAVQVWPQQSQSGGKSGESTSGAITEHTSSFRKVTSNGLQFYGFEEGYHTISALDANHMSISFGFAKHFPGITLTTDQRDKINEALKQENNKQVIIQWSGWEMASYKDNCNFFYLYGFVQSCHGITDRIPVYAVVRGSVGEVEEYVKNYELLASLGNPVITRGQGADPNIPVMSAWPVNLSKNMIDWCVSGETHYAN
jgi:hypothetical protein